VLRDGSFHLTGLCVTGGSRLVRSGGAEGLKSVVPNPASGTVRIEYDLIEEGRCRLMLTDLLGRTVGTVEDADRVAGSYTATFETALLPTGIYVIVLETATGRMSGMMEVVR
jgi:hypothetical protein